MIKKISILLVFISLIFSGCSNTQPSINKLANTNKINLYNQDLFYPKNMEENLYKTEVFRGNYQYKEGSSYREDKKEGLIKLENIYETVDFKSPIYIEKINFQYNICKERSAVNSAGIGLFSVALSPLMMFGRSLGVSPAYDEMHVVDQNGKKSLEKDNDKYIGCDYDFKYKGFTNYIKVYFDSIHYTNKKAEDLVKKRSLNNYYEVTYIPSYNIQKIIEFNLENRTDTALNDELLNSIVLSDNSSYEYYKDNKEKYNISQYSILNLPENSDILFSAKNGQKILDMGIYKDNKKGLITTNKFFTMDRQYNIEIKEEEVGYDEKEKNEESYTDFKDRLSSYINSLIDIWNNTIDLKNTRLGIDGKTELYEYEKLRRELLTNFKKYDKANKLFNKELDKQLAQRNEYYKNLREYFKYRSYKKAQSKYQTSMKKSFGRVLDDKVWCKNNICPSMDAIEDVIIKEAGRKWYAKSKGLPPYLSINDFLEHKIVKEKVISELTNLIEKKSKIRNIKIDDFQYGYDDFINLRYELALKYGLEDIKKLYGEAESKIDIRKTLEAKSWREFIMVNDFKSKLEEICDNKKLTNEIYSKLLNERIDLSNLFNIYKQYN